jgi:hypothetical protein
MEMADFKMGTSGGEVLNVASHWWASLCEELVSDYENLCRSHTVGEARPADPRVLARHRGQCDQGRRHCSNIWGVLRPKLEKSVDLVHARLDIVSNLGMS